MNSTDNSDYSDYKERLSVFLTDYTNNSDINVSMTGYACGAEGVSENTAWSEIKNHYGID